MTPKRILVTGASGCIGHYISEALIQDTDHELFLMVRNPDKLGINCQARPGIHVVKADMLQIETLGELLKTIDVAILTATAWGGMEAFDVNVVKTIRLMNLLDPERCQQVLYFSTASVLDRQQKLLKEAGQIGTEYIRSKYDCKQRIAALAIAPKVTTLYPTLVLGGDEKKPYSHLSSGIGEVIKWIDLIRFIKADGSFHFIHGRDIAQVVLHLIKNPPPAGQRDIVLGNAPITVNEAIEEACRYLNRNILFRIPLSSVLADVVIKVFNIQMAAWDRFCMQYRHFTYEHPVSPKNFGLPGYCATFSDVLKVSGVAPKG